VVGIGQSDRFKDLRPKGLTGGVIVVAGSGN